MKELKEYPGYFITMGGEVYSSKRGNSLRKLSTWVGKSHGYVLVRLGAKFTARVHRLIAEAYIPNPHCLPEVNHKDRDRANNDLDNLEWVNHQQNLEHACSKHYTLLNVNNGEMVSVFNLRKFARENNLHQSHLGATKKPTLSGGRRTHRGWTIIS